jgi:hypothetical protein
MLETIIWLLEKHHNSLIFKNIIEVVLNPTQSSSSQLHRVDEDSSLPVWVWFKMTTPICLNLFMKLDLIIVKYFI